MKVFCFDTETTGLISNHIIALDRQPEVIEFYGALVDLKRRRVLKDYHTLIKPQKFPMDQYTIEETRTQLSNEMLATAPPFSAVAEPIRKIIETAPLALAHNVAFDQEMLSVEYERLKQSMKWPRLICTVEQTIHLRGKRLSLTELHKELFNEPFPDAHRARPDVEALIRCCYELFKRELL